MRHKITVTNPFGPGVLTVGKPVEEQGLRQAWTLLDAKLDPFTMREGVMLIVREHSYHPFVTERFAWRADDNEFIVWSGTYHETLADARSEFNRRVKGQNKYRCPQCNRSDGETHTCLGKLGTIV
jgi:hypothetical protein